MSQELQELPLEARLRRLIGEQSFTRYEEFWREQLAKYPIELLKVIDDGEKRAADFVPNLGGWVAVQVRNSNPAEARSAKADHQPKRK